MPKNREDGKHDLSWISGGGEMGELIRSMDWSKTALGPIETWPQSLRTSVSLCLSSTFPILLAWGPEDIQIYNDSYRPICGELHPGSMGQNFKICWESALPVVGDKFDRAHQGEGTYIRDQRMFLNRYGYLEEAFMTFSFGGIRDESGDVGGIFHPITETTVAMLSARRTQVLKDFATRLATAKSISEVSNLARQGASEYDLDLPFFALYAIDENRTTATLVGSAGLEADTTILQNTVSLADSPWQFEQALVSTQEVSDLQVRFGDFNAGPYENAPTVAVVSALSPAGMKEPFGFLIAGVSARRALDTEYRNFFSLLSNTFNTAISNVFAFEEEAKRAAALAELDRAKTDFFSNVSHEFRTPLTLILGPTEDALKETDLTPVQRQRLELTQRNSLRLLKLVNSLLDFSRVEAGRVQASYNLTNVVSLTADLVSVFRSTTERAGLELIFSAEKDLDLLYVDIEMWEKIVLNLISNAFKFTLRGSIKVSMTRASSGIELRVADTGVGIPALEIPKLFQRFHRVQGAQGRSFEGSGIGLSLVHELVRLHGGNIRIESTEDVGSTFIIQVPSGSAHLPPDRVGARAPEQMESRPLAFAEEAQRWLVDENKLLQLERSPGEARKRILLVDDNNDMRGYVENLLNVDCDVMTAVDGIDALEKIRSHRPDLVLTDVMMPRLDGFGLLAAIRAEASTKTLPVILLSARAGEEARVEGLRAGADDYLVKPFSAKELQTRVLSALNLEAVRESKSQELRKNEEDAKQASLSKSLFLANMSHEIRTPLGVIQGFAELLLEEGKFDGESFKALTTIRRNAAELTTIINDILDLSKVEAGKLEVEQVSFDVVSMMDDVMILMGLRAQEKRIHLNYSVAPGTPTWILSDPTRVRQILVNVIGNAVKFTDRGSVEIDVRAKDRQLVFTVTDTGIGIEMSDKAKLFEPFTQADATVTRRFGGTGLGLGLSRNLATALGGRIELLKSTPGVGSTFEFSIRLEEDVTHPVKRESAQPIKADALKGLRILLVEDSVDNQDLMTRYLHNLGVTMQIAEDGHQAVAAAMSNDFDVVLMDIQLPNLDGHSATKILRDRGYKVPIIALTAHAMREERDRALAGGFNGYLTKPLNRTLLVETLQKYRTRKS